MSEKSGWGKSEGNTPGRASTQRIAESGHGAGWPPASRSGRTGLEESGGVGAVQAAQETKGGAPELLAERPDGPVF